MNTYLADIAKDIQGLDPVASLQYFAQKYPGEITFSTSFGWEDQVITDLIFRNDVPIEVFTLETGRLFPETYYVWNRTLEIYKKKIHAYFPQAAPLQAMVDQKGPNSFYESVENRKECCHIRKIEPLKRALNGKKIWVTGIRGEQSLNRHDMSNIEWDEGNQLLKFHPLFNWTLEEVKAYIKENNVVYNTLHDKGFPSIGCAPCTRAVREGEDFRAGRWWWEDQSKKECGLHATQQ
ncbi:phosphoadenylyl-sulfate reductase [Pedobacter sp. HMWF019]|uniref:phosphoadenylyl-sulfate reductase n=1 Tax=Pedobacter sp. HMWF019 TaxID=2056856 RepID=UPI000D356576|nr:phosphoadenylyl-sulfate reductase [Pedobacter sp. HMWF019]PTT03394.1 phosphoadenylyl-sulfate reductase [Pedobacter sp. HMWF019]